MSELIPVIGLEIHAQLKTESKAFCSCSANYGDPPNSNTCPVCLGHPGALPVPNGKMVNMAILAGIAAGCNISNILKFERKNYFYRDLPKGYQITQDQFPLCGSGLLEFESEGVSKKINIRRIHLEEDSGKSILREDGSAAVDFNRCGIPLIEIVTEPEISSAKEAAGFYRELRSLLIFLGICTGDMEKGALRCDANVSLKSTSGEVFERSEIKNLNSFKNLEKAVDFEIKKQSGIVSAGGETNPQTMLWDEANLRTLPMRSKEDSRDYRYFPEPDIPDYEIENDLIEKLRMNFPGMPMEIRKKLTGDYGIRKEFAEIISSNGEYYSFFRKILSKELKNYNIIKTASNIFINDLLKIIEDNGIKFSESKADPGDIMELAQSFSENRISSNSVREVIERLALEGGTARDIIERGSYAQISGTSELTAIAEKITAENPEAVEKYRSGKASILGFLIGAAMKESSGKADPKKLKKILKDLLK